MSQNQEFRSQQTLDNATGVAGKEEVLPAPELRQTATLRSDPVTVASVAIEFENGIDCTQTKTKLTASFLYQSAKVDVDELAVYWTESSGIFQDE